jgi:ribosomal protein S18 acetylase RimI-like enzyme
MDHSSRKKSELWVGRVTPLTADGASIERLLTRVYVEEGFTDAEVARAAFVAPTVLKRGELFVAREANDPEALLGMVMLVPHTSPARRFANDGESELHLLAVVPEARGHGVGRALVDAVMLAARELGSLRMLLWTQPTMQSAHRLYERAGFQRAPERDFETGGRAFLFYEAIL